MITLPILKKRGSWNADRNGSAYDKYEDPASDRVLFSLLFQIFPHGSEILITDYADHILYGLDGCFTENIH